MIRTFLTRTLAASVIVVCCMAVTGCDGGGSSTGPNGQQTRDKAEAGKPPVQAPGPGAGGEFQQSGGKAAPPARPTTPPAEPGSGG